MTGSVLSRIPPRGAQSKREFAHFRPRVEEGYGGIEFSCERFLVDGRASKRASAHCQHRYPSPCRSVLPKDRPATPFLPLNSADKRHFAKNGVELSGCTGDSPVVNNPNKGNSTCARHPGSSLPPPFSASLAALRPIFSAAQPVLLPVLFSPIRSAPTRPQPLSRAPLPVCSATTQASAARPAEASAPRARTHDNRRRRGPSPAAVLRLKD